MSSKTYRLVKRILKKLSSKTKRSLLTLIPIAIITGLIDLLVVALVSRVFTAVVGQENKPPIPFSDLITALIQAGGVDTTVTLRNIQLKRNEKAIKVFDFYSYILEGKYLNKTQLRDNDIIFVSRKAI